MAGRVLLWLLVLAMALTGLALLAGGAVLVVAGGSVYYALAGAVLLASTVGLVRRRRWAVPLYGVLLALTLVWALYEAGLDGWALVPRMIAPAVLALVLLVPAVRRRSAQPAAAAWLLAPLAGVALAFAGAAAGGGWSPPGLVGAKTVAAEDAQDGEWRNWGRSLSGERFSPLAQITPANVGRLEKVWEFRSDVEPMGFHSFEATPLAVDGRLFVCLDRDVFVAVDQDTGRELWRHDAKPNLDGVFAANCRGVSYFEAPESAAGPCARRIIAGVHDARLIALDAATGRPCSDFGTDGSVDLREGLGDFPAGIMFPTSPPAIVDGVAVLSGWVTDGLNTDEPSGVIRAYDAMTGELRWAWDYGRSDPTAPLGEGETYTRGAPNAWGVFSADPELGLVYVPTGVSTPDYSGTHRSPGAEIYANAIVALDVRTGKPLWHFQTIHHDLWDWDIGSQPVLTQVRKGGRLLPALIAPTKRGEFFVLDRRDGTPIYPVEERPVPQDAAEGEWVSKTQPYSAFPNVAGPPLREQDMWGATPLDQLWCRIRFLRAKYEGDFTPPSVETAIHYPGSAGGSNWGSVTVDPVRRLMIANSLYMADIARLIPRAEVERLKYADGTSSESFGFIQEGTPYAIKREVFLNPLGVPCQEPPYGRLTVTDLDTGKVRWSQPLGTAYHAGPLGLSSFLPIRMGVPNLGGSMVTASGLVFIGATQDRRFRAIDVSNGRELWSAALPAIGAATPMTYRSPRSGRQYVVIAAGGHPGLPGPVGGSLVAYALPER